MVIGVTGGLGSLISNIIQLNGGIVDGIGGHNEWMNDMELNQYYNYHDKLYKDKISEDHYDFIFDAADGKRLLCLYFRILKSRFSYEWVPKHMSHDESFLISYSSPLMQMIDSQPETSPFTFRQHHQLIESNMRSDGGKGKSDDLLKIN